MYQRPSARDVPKDALFDRHSTIQGAFGKGLYRDQRYTSRALRSAATSDEGAVSDFHILMALVTIAALLDWAFFG